MTVYGTEFGDGCRDTVPASEADVDVVEHPLQSDGRRRGSDRNGPERGA